MKYFLNTLFILLFLSSFAQEKTTIKVIVPNKDDEVYIVGNQTDLGDWSPNKVKMYKVSDYLRMISIPFYFPAEFMFTKGSWETEGIIYSLDNNPNIYLEDYKKEVVFKIKGWKDDMLKAQYITNYKNEPFESDILNEKRKLKVYTPENYSITKRYPVIFTLDIENNFKTIASILDNWRNQDYKPFPDCILIGIPLLDSEQPYLGKTEYISKQLIKYVTYDVLPFVEAKFNTSGFHIIAGKGHEADFIHQLILEDNSPFKAVINMNSTNIKDFEKAIFYLENNTDKTIFYYLAKAQLDNQFDDTHINQISNSENFQFKTKVYPTYLNNIMLSSFQDALLYTFKDYRNLKDYSDFNDFYFNYAKKVKDTYNMSVSYHQNEVDYFLKDILEKQDVETYNLLLNFLDTYEVISKNGERYSFSEIEKATHLFQLGLYEECIIKWEYFLENIDQYDDNFKKLFFDDIETVLKSYVNSGETSEVFDFLNKCIEKIPTYILESYYYKAKYSSKYKIFPVEGKDALEFCYNYYHENDYFDLKDLDKIIIN